MCTEQFGKRYTREGASGVTGRSLCSLPSKDPQDQNIEQLQNLPIREETTIYML
jgi:hypothetical protein